jgi:hypothetical protein
MKILTKQQREQMIRNAELQKQATVQDKSMDFHPVVKLFTPWANATWLLTELDPDTNIAFGLCDLGLGCPEMGYVSLDEILSVTGPAGLTVERDRHFKATHTLSRYAEAARAHSAIVENLEG